MALEITDGMRRPAGLQLLTAVLLASPALHFLALLFGRRWLNLGSPHPWDGFAYFIAAPVVGALMLRRHERARFAAYVFWSCEILRAIRINSWALGLLSVTAILYLQLPAVRRFHPMVDPRQVMARLRLGSHASEPVKTVVGMRSPELVIGPRTRTLDSTKAR
jgi:hypothetical protein